MIHGQKLSDKEAEVSALHEAILWNVRMRVTIIAEEQHLDLVIIDDGGNIKGLILLMQWRRPIEFNKELYYE